MTAGLLAALLAAAAPAAAAPKTKMAVGTLPALTSSALFIARDKGFFSAEGLDVELTLLRDNEELLRRLEDGRLDAGGAGFNAAFYAAAARGKVRAVADKGRTSRRGFRVLVAAARGRPAALDAAALRGRLFAFSVRGYESEIVLERYLRARGLELSDVRLTTVPYALMGKALAEGTVFGAVLIEPFLSSARRAGAVVEEADAMDLYPGQQGAAVVFSEALRRRRGEAVRFLKAYARACRWYAAALEGPDRGELRDIVARGMRLPDPAALDGAAWPGLDPEGRLALESVAADLLWHQARADAPKGLKPSDLADASLLEDALKP